MSILRKFFIFNATISKREDTEHENVLYYWPPHIALDRQTCDIGLARGLIGFANTFSPHKPLEVMQTEKHQQVFHSPEPDFWCVMQTTRPDPSKPAREDREPHYRILLSVLQKACRMFTLLRGSLCSLLSRSPDTLRHTLSAFFPAYLPTLALALESADLLDTLDGIQYLPVDRVSFLKMQSFVNKVETRFREVVATTVLVDDFLVYSGLNQNDTRCVYSFLTKRQARKCSPGEHVDHLVCLGEAGFLLKDPRTKEIATLTLHLTAHDNTVGLIVWQYSRALFAFFVTPGTEQLAFHDSLEQFLNQEIGTTVQAVTDHVSRSPLFDETYQYIYFNRMNLALKSSLRKRGTIVGSPLSAVSTTDISELMHFIESMHSDLQTMEGLKEVIVKTRHNDQWVVGRRSGEREFYAIFEGKHTLAEVEEELKKINLMFFNGIFID
eukprot:NODE_1702_length_1408_cov_37.103044_g1616_i0.p1 GENE.NODE_1702_length_1408_cov_37.103044_g1616_i0~~NODE_1702_length_1408_cov_37.103044_g1616_i0.p1  ORF type:complete len:439 (+),score=133.73 NODE_1702_length_1408_cov_37.103044_g1616_i0:82-1398(+)